MIVSIYLPFYLDACILHCIDSLKSFILQLYNKILNSMDMKQKAEHKKQNPRKHLQFQKITACHCAQDRSTSSAVSSPPASYVYLYPYISTTFTNKPGSSQKEGVIHTRLRTSTPNLPLPPIPIIPHIPRPKNTIQQPPSDPIRPVFAIRRPALEQAAHEWRRIVTDLEDPPALAVRADMVPEEGGPCCWVGAHVVQQVGGIGVHAVVDNNCFILGWG